ncbi:MAG: transketolase C-terminal domain-containing protein [Nocardioidaceae bacterium]
MDDARERRVGIHADTSTWLGGLPPTPRPANGSSIAEASAGPVPPAEAAPASDEARLAAIPESSGARARRPTSSQAAFGRSLRALDDLGLPVLEAIRDDADPRDLGALRCVATGSATAFAVPRLVVAEPAFAQAVDWMLCAALASLDQPGTTSYYFRLTPRPLDQTPFELAGDRLGAAVLRRQVLTGAYRLVDGTARRPRVQIAAVGPTLPEAVEAAAALEADGIGVDVVDVVSPDAVFAAWQRSLLRAVRTGATPSIAGALRQAFHLDVPLVTVHDQGTAGLAWLGSALGVPTVTVGGPPTGSPSSAGPSGSSGPSVESGTLVSAALAALSL